MTRFAREEVDRLLGRTEATAFDLAGHECVADFSDPIPGQRHDPTVLFHSALGLPRGVCIFAERTAVCWRHRSHSRTCAIVKSSTTSPQAPPNTTYSIPEICRPLSEAPGGQLHR